MLETAKAKFQTIELLRWPMALLVVCIHADFVKSGLSVQGECIEMSHSNLAYHVITYISQILGRIAVPLFFMISGYLYFRNYSEKMSWSEKLSWYKQKVVSRTKSLLVPLIAWNLLMCLSFAVRQYTPLHRFFPNASFNWSLLAVLSSPFDFICDASHHAPIDNPLWFVRNLFAVGLLAPLMLTRRISLVLLTVFAAVWMFNVKDEYLVLPTLVFFLAGGVISMYNKPLVLFCNRIGYALIIITYLALSVVDLFSINDTLKEETLYYSQPLHNFTVLIGTFAALSLVEWIVSKRRCSVISFFSQSSFVIFAFHSFILYDIGKVYVKLFYRGNLSSLDELLIYFMSIAISVAVSMVVYKILKKSRILSTLFIGR